jgi:hypothetical protein
LRATSTTDRRVLLDFPPRLAQVHQAALMVSSPSSTRGRLPKLTRLRLGPVACPLRPATQDEQNTVHRFWVSAGGIGGDPGTGVAPVGKMDPPELPNIFRGTALQWRRWVRTCTSTAPWTPIRGAYQRRFTPRNASCGSLMAHCAMRVDITDKAPQQPKSLRGLSFHQSGRPDSNWGPPAPKAEPVVADFRQETV